MEGVIHHTLIELGPPTEEPIIVDIGTYKLSFFQSYIETIAGVLEANKVSMVHLQPGDGTRYVFYLIPQVGDLKAADRFGPDSNPWAEDRMLWLAPVNLSSSGGVMVDITARGNIYYDLECYSNPHTKKVITVFFDLLYQELLGIELIPLTFFSSNDEDLN